MEQSVELVNQPDSGNTMKELTSRNFVILLQIDAIISSFFCVSIPTSFAEINLHLTIDSTPTRASYKCGVFFKDLSPKVPLAWLGALPEAVVRARKEGATDNDVIELLGSNVDGPSYDNFECGDVGANTRCYAQVSFILEMWWNSQEFVRNLDFSDAESERRRLRLLW